MNMNLHDDATPSETTPGTLANLGWSPFFQAQLDGLANPDGLPARVVGVRKDSFLVSRDAGEWRVTVAGRLNYSGEHRYPVAGDWVLVRQSVITAVLARKNVLSRGGAGTRGRQEALPRREQVMAANLDTVFVVCGLDRDFNLRRIERYLTLIYNCGLDPAIILTKADLHADPERFGHEVEAVVFGVPVHLVSARESNGLDRLAAYLRPGRTITLVGSSGAGKSTLLNRLYGQPIQATAAVSGHVGKGTHTTTRRDLIVMPQGGMIIDNPGIREISFWELDGGIAAAFPEIERLAAACRFADCSHVHEPGCRVRQAVAQGEIAAERLASFHKMQRERTYLAGRQQMSASRVEKQHWKPVAAQVKALKKGKWRRGY